MNRQEIIKIIRKEKLVAILRTKNQEIIELVLETVISEGIKVLEITSNTPGYLAAISKARKSYPDVLIGAGTVINTKIAEKVIQAGAQFLVTPNVNLEVIRVAHQNNIPVIMGALTPTEICEAHENGADIVKLFPAGNLGIEYFNAIKGPLDNIHYFAVGGVEFSDARKWFDAGVEGIGYGCLMKNPENGAIDIEETRKIARNYVKLVKENS
ncbi:bifunctional 4-hydroxy-2-oxoglutarate aldolase/2-dehydro-3-deoxy-phosphogluconate aldolase [Flavobacterium sp. NG2]|uniref:bifunctional 4-hydroxy-2-oxoglutarate aldolase/2-dehydro-3-deoxy-phosphogluconate aldolase n=1 Tax=Flavobacterium sp. NG2 TaxID=3097547 RepID=UPI002A830271|nr:bifunctional 4-hydroxy-2-oxoglutarate aldolase/2-dehydro-3-deoxy-phosphogluconate aldolase [Flavobacterium sp. NG2]WPR71097.1 bifunctional 4-hydroxy-2-oxoglutarate aldolase/2-dehydro-3-deoxy-phosphogluconate aldolase [Flavobacterium sp. NG2]